MRNKTITIVIEDRGGEHFDVYLSGDKERMGNIEENLYTPAEYWASIFYQACVEILREEGMVQSEMNTKGALH